MDAPLKLPPGFSTSWRIMDDRAICDLVFSPGTQTPLVMATAEVMHTDWNHVALLGAKMVEMAAVRMKEATPRVQAVPAGALDSNGRIQGGIKIVK